jgi:hypothetical protein
MHPVATGLLSESVGPRVGAARGRLAVQRLIREECVQLASVRGRRMVPISTVCTSHGLNGRGGCLCVLCELTCIMTGADWTEFVSKEIRGF